MCTAAGLVNHDLGVRQAEALALGAGRKQHGGHGRGHTDADGGDLRLDEVHGVQNRQAGVNLAAGRIDVERDILLGILALKMQQLGNDQVGADGVDLLAQEDDAVVEQARIDIVAALAARRLLDNVWHEGGIELGDHTHLHFSYGPIVVLDKRTVPACYALAGTVRSNRITGV